MKSEILITQANIEMCKELAEIKKQVWETTYRGIYPDFKFDNFNIDIETEKFKTMINNPNINFLLPKLKIN